MASILVLSDNGANVMWAKKFAEEGHIVKMWVHKNVYNLLSESKNPSLLKSPTKLIEQFDLIIGDYGLGAMCRDIQDDGKLVLFGSRFIDLMANDPDYHSRLIEIVYGRERDEVSDDDVVTSAWFSKGEFYFTTRARLYERLMDGGKGTRIADMGCALECIDEAPILTPLAAFLKDLEYVGPIHVRHLEDSVKMVLPGYHSNIQQAEFELIKGDRFKAIIGLCNGGTPDIVKECAISIKLSLSPYPFAMGVNGTRYDWRIDEAARRHIWECDCVNGVLGYVTSRGSDLSECRRRAYRTVRLNVQDREIQYRSDIGDA